MTSWIGRITGSAARTYQTCEVIANTDSSMFIAHSMGAFARNSKCVLVLVGVLAVADPQAAPCSGEPCRAPLHLSWNPAACERSTACEGS